MVNKVKRIQNNKDGILENNCELAKENGQLRQQLNQYQLDYAQQSERILELKTQINDLIAIKNKYNSIVKIVLDIGDEVTTTVGAILPSSSISSSNHSASNHSVSDESQLEQSQVQQQNQNQTASSSNQIDLNRITERSEEDSLQPRNCTSVAPFRLENNDHTPSVWKVLDDVEIEKSTRDQRPREETYRIQTQHQQNSVLELRLSNGSMNSSPIHPVGSRRIGGNNPIFHSTPVRNKGVNQENQENLQRLSKSLKPDEVQNVNPKNQAKSKERAVKRPQSKQTNNDEAPRYNLRKRARQQVA